MNKTKELKTVLEVIKSLKVFNPKNENLAIDIMLDELNRLGFEIMKKKDSLNKR